jgi:hypothetical protein
MPDVERRGRYVVQIDVVTGIHIHLEIMRHLCCFAAALKVSADELHREVSLPI